MRHSIAQPPISKIEHNKNEKKKRLWKIDDMSLIFFWLVYIEAPLHEFAIGPHRNRQTFSLSAAAQIL